MTVGFDAVQIFAPGPVGAVFGEHGARLEPARLSDEFAFSAGKNV